MLYFVAGCSRGRLELAGNDFFSSSKLCYNKMLMDVIHLLINRELHIYLIFDCPPSTLRMKIFLTRDPFVPRCWQRQSSHDLCDWLSPGIWDTWRGQCWVWAEISQVWWPVTTTPGFSGAATRTPPPGREWEWSRWECSLGLMMEQPELARLSLVLLELLWMGVLNKILILMLQIIVIVYLWSWWQPLKWWHCWLPHTCTDQDTCDLDPHST